MDACCSDKASAIDQLRMRQASTLCVVLVVNAGMFAIEFASGLLAGSLALLADSLDMLSDALVYGFSLYVVNRGDVWKARAAVVKAVVMGVFGMFVAGQLAWKLLNPSVPSFEGMGVVGALALVANLVCFILLWKHRAEDVNMRSVWLCSRNDVAANAGVLVAAAAVWFTDSAWPDIAVGTLIAALFLRSAVVVFREARVELETATLGTRRLSRRAE